MWNALDAFAQVIHLPIPTWYLGQHLCEYPNKKRVVDKRDKQTQMCKNGKYRST